jgi:hypothetical protein
VDLMDILNQLLQGFATAATPVDMRYYLAAVPAVAIAAAAGASWLWTGATAQRAVAGGLLAWAAVTGIIGVLQF